MALAELIGSSPGIVAVREQVVRLVDRPGGRMPPVLLLGETGTGKGLLARALHAASPRRSAPFVDVNCAAIPENLLEAELFGVERGAFTGADRGRAGLFQAANGGTLFLDEIGLVPEAVQSKLLKAVEERTVRRLGRTASEPVDVWVLAATSEDLEEAMRSRRFRRDLYHRLAVVTLRLPPLRERGPDVELLAAHFLARVCADYGLPQKALSGSARAAIRAHPWPGNVRELGNVIERAGLLSDDAELTAEALGLGDAPGGAPAAGGRRPAGGALREMLEGAERQRVLEALEESGWNLSRAAARLELPRNTLRYRMERFGLRQPPPSRRRVAPAAAPAPAPPAPRAAGRGERRRITWLRADLRGASPDGAALDPGRALEVLADKVRAFGGRIETASRARLAAAFGLEPIEDAPRRAALAALAARKAVEDPRRDGRGPWSLAIAIHIHECQVEPGTAGPVIDADGARAAQAVLEALVGEAPPGSVLVSAAAAAVLERRFDLRGRGQAPGDTGRVYELTGPEHAGFRVRGRVTPFIGRREELEWLRARLAAARGGHAQVVGIVGEAGIGKSRLIAELRQTIDAQPTTYLEGRCVSHATTTPYQPILAVVRQLCGIGDTDGPEAIAARVHAAVASVGVDPRDAAPYILDLLGVAGHVGGMSPEMVRTRTFEALRTLVLQATRSCALVIAIEDAHWIDETSDALLAELVEGLSRARLLLLLTYRPGYRPRWLDRSYAAQLSLQPLSPGESLEVVRSMLAAQPVSTGLVQTILARGEGNPFFLEELTRALGDDAGERSEPIVPGTIHDVLAARIAKLDAGDRRLLQTAAVVGKEVGPDVLCAVADEPAERLAPRLQRLQAAEFLTVTGIGPRPVYAFQHALTHEVAYGSLPPEARRLLHSRILDALEALPADRAAEAAEPLARHALGAERWEEAVRHLRHSAAAALARSAHRESVALVEQALGALAHLPEGAERWQRELSLQMTRGVALIGMHGYAAPAVEHAYERARALCRQVGQTPRLLGALLGLWVFHLFRAEMDIARELAEQCLAVVAPYPESPLRGWAHLAAGVSSFWLGDLGRARRELEQSFALYDVDEQAPLAAAYGQDGGATALAYLAVLWSALDHSDRGVQRAEAAIALAEKVSHPYTMAAALAMSAATHQLRREPRRARPPAEAAVALATAQGFPMWRAMATVLRGWAMSEEGQLDEGIDEMRRGVTAWRSLGSELAAPWFLTVLADALCQRGRTDEGLATVAEALDLAARKQDRWYESETHRVQGALLAQCGRAPEAEAALRRAVDLARAREATSFELRAALALARLWTERGDREEARRLLGAVCARLAEGVDPPDVVEARALLAELA